MRTDLQDAGCAETFELLDRYVETELSNGDAGTRYPRIAVHLSTCDPCVEVCQGLMAAVADQPTEQYRSEDLDQGTPNRDR